MVYQGESTCFFTIVDYNSLERVDEAYFTGGEEMAKGNWLTDLAIGRSTESVIAGILVEAGLRVMAGPNTYAYDMAVGIPGLRCHLLEVKDESNYASSPNLCLEFHAGEDEHPSGIYTTEANLQVHVFGEQCYLFKTQPMRNFLHDKLHEGTYEIKRFRNGDNKVAGVLVPKADIASQPWCDVIELERLAESNLWRE
jgi:hypothetical protein